MNILFCCDSNYAMPLTVCITSIFENNKDSSVKVYIFHSNMSQKQEDTLQDLARQYNQSIEALQIDEHYFSDVPTLRWTKETYYRLLLCELLPDTTDKVLYMDCDIIVNKPLDYLFNIDLQDKYIAALKENVDHIAYRKRLGLHTDGYYFQAGVILFDLQKVRKVLGYTTALEIIKNLGNRLIAVDQDVLNVLFDEKILGLPQAYNDCEITIFNKNNWSRLLNIEDKDRLNKTVIFHYATGKPWNNLYSGSCEQIWYKYLRLSPYKSLYESKFNTLKYKVLRTGFFKTLVFTYIHITPIINSLTTKILPKKTYASLKSYYRKHIK